MLLSAMVSGAMAAVAVGAAPNATADCASFFGLGNTAHCQSGPASIAIAIGPNATAKAGGLFGAAFAIGAAPVSGAAGDKVTAQAGDLFGIAMQWGNNGQTTTKGIGNVAQGWTNPFGGDPSATWVETTLASGFGNQILNGAFSAFRWGHRDSGPGPPGRCACHRSTTRANHHPDRPGIKVTLPTTPAPGGAATFRSAKKPAATPTTSAGSGTKTGVASSHRGHQH